jgi:hypothetical protein
MIYPSVLPSAYSNGTSERVSTEEQLATAIVEIVSDARAQGQSLEELIAQVLAEDPELDKFTRRWLGEIIAEAWHDFSEAA